MALFDQFGNPVSTARMTARASCGSLSGWRGQQVLSREGESRERGVMQRRAADLAANDWAAHSAVEAVSGNAIGTGLVPKASIPADMLGIPSEADVRGQCHFADLQNLGVRTMLGMGEMLHLAVMFGGGGVRTAGARAGYGRPEGYYLATPKASPARGAERAAGDGLHLCSGPRRPPSERVLSVPARDGRAGARRLGLFQGHRAVPHPFKSIAFLSFR